MRSRTEAKESIGSRTDSPDISGLPNAFQYKALEDMRSLPKEAFYYCRY